MHHMRKSLLAMTASAVLLAACATADFTGHSDDCLEVLIGGVEFDCSNYRFETSGAVIRVRNLPKVPSKSPGRCWPDRNRAS